MSNKLDPAGLFGPLQEVQLRPRVAVEHHGGYVELDLKGHTAFLCKEALRELYERGREAARIPIEVSFLCMGRREVDGRGPYAIVEKVSFLAEGETTTVPVPVAARRQSQADHPALDIVGWAHTHPGYGIFFSSPDVETCGDYGPDSINLVFDPKSNKMGVALGDQIFHRVDLSRILEESAQARFHETHVASLPAKEPAGRGKPPRVDPIPPKKWPRAEPAECGEQLRLEPVPTARRRVPKDPPETCDDPAPIPTTARNWILGVLIMHATALTALTCSTLDPPRARAAAPARAQTAASPRPPNVAGPPTITTGPAEAATPSSPSVPAKRAPRSLWTTLDFILDALATPKRDTDAIRNTSSAGSDTKLGSPGAALPEGADGASGNLPEEG